MGVTPNFSFPYPASTDFVKDGATNIEDLADAVDTSLYAVTSPWITYVPTLVQLNNVSKTVNYAKYKQIGKTVIGNVSISPNNGGTANNAVKIGLPVTASTTGNLVGNGTYYDLSTSVFYILSATTFTTTTVQLSFNAPINTWGISPNLAMAAGDFFAFNFCYEAA